MSGVNCDHVFNMQGENIICSLCGIRVDEAVDIIAKAELGKEVQSISLRKENTIVSPKKSS